MKYILLILLFASCHSKQKIEYARPIELRRIDSIRNDTIFISTLSSLNDAILMAEKNGGGSIHLLKPKQDSVWIRPNVVDSVGDNTVFISNADSLKQ